MQISIKAIGLNRAESMFRSGQYLEEPKLPAKLGYEAAGTVAAIGPGVEGFKVGDAVSTIPSFSLNDYGALSTEPTPLPLFDVLAKWVTIRGYVMMEITSDPARLERGVRFVNEGLADKSLKPIIAKRFPLEQIVEAHRYLESNQQIGKVVVTV